MKMPVEDQFGSEQGSEGMPLAGPMSWSRIRIYTGKPFALDIENMASLWDAAVASLRESLTLHEYDDKVTGAVDNLYGRKCICLCKCQHPGSYPCR